MANPIIKGLKGSFAIFDVFSNEVHQACKGVLRDGIKQVAKEAKAAAPVDSREYKRSIKWTVAKSGLIAWAYASRKGDTKYGYIGHLLEYGTVHAPAKPHWAPAVDRVKAAFGRDLEVAVKSVRGGR